MTAAIISFGASYYDPETGRWLNKDPIRFDGGDANPFVNLIEGVLQILTSFGNTDTYKLINNLKKKREKENACKK